jgi:hypothetical protein
VFLLTLCPHDPWGVKFFASSPSAECPLSPSPKSHLPESEVTRSCGLA